MTTDWQRKFDGSVTGDAPYEVHNSRREFAVKLDLIKCISVLGPGIMGHGIAQAFLMAGYPVNLYDGQESISKTAKAHIRENLELFHDAGLRK